MTYQAPDGWRLPPSNPQHATPADGSAHLSSRAHRALRLFVTAGAWGAGLCLIIGSVALVAARSRWELQWSYACAPHAGRGALVIREGNAGGGGVSVAEMGAAGHGSTWTYSSVGTHYLVVITNCAWAIEVTGRR